MNDFEIGDDGKLVLHPLSGWTTGILPSLALVARLFFLVSEDPEEHNSVQLLMDASQCRDLGGLLLRMADELEQLT